MVAVWTSTAEAGLKAPPKTGEAVADLQFGGHIQPTGSTFVAAANREMSEESGRPDTELFS